MQYSTQRPMIINGRWVDIRKYWAREKKHQFLQLLMRSREPCPPKNVPRSWVPFGSKWFQTPSPSPSKATDTFESEKIFVNFASRERPWVWNNLHSFSLEKNVGAVAKFRPQPSFDCEFSKLEILNLDFFSTRFLRSLNLKFFWDKWLN